MTKTKTKTKAQLAHDNKILLSATRAMNKTITQQRDKVLKLTHELHTANVAIRNHGDNVKRAVAQETAALQQQVLLKADAIDGFKDQVEALWERVRDLDRKLLDEKAARKKEGQESDTTLNQLASLKNKLFHELEEAREEHKRLQSENARIKSLHVSAMEFIGTHIQFLKANHQ